MSGRLTPIGKVVKFLLIPLAIAVVGFFVLGPIIVSRSHKRTPQAAPDSESVDAPAEEQKR